MYPTNITDVVEEDLVDYCGDAPSLLDQPWIRYPTMMLYLFVFAACLIGNLFTLLVILFHPMMRTATNYFLANLAAADLLVAVFCILQNMIHIFGYENGNWPLGEIMCKMYVMMLHMVPSTSIGILVCVSIEKYIAVLHPLKAFKWLTQSHRSMATIGVWTVGFLSNVVYFFKTKVFVFGDQKACGRAEDLKWLVTTSFVIWYVLPLICLGFIYFRIGFLLWTTGGSSVRAINRQSSDSLGSTGASWHMGNGRVVLYQPESLLQVPLEETRRQQKQYRDQLEGRRKVVRLLVAVVISFAVLSFPHHARLLQGMWSPAPSCNSDWSFLLQPLSYLCLFISSAINPILYALMSRRFRDAAADILTCRRGLFRVTKSRTRTLVSDLPDESRAASPHMNIRMNRVCRNP